MRVLRASPQSYFASESHMDMLAHELHLDPLEFRRLHAERSKSDPLQPDAQQLEVVRRAVQTADWSRARGAWRGRGIAVGDHGVGVGLCHDSADSRGATGGSRWRLDCPTPVPAR